MATWTSPAEKTGGGMTARIVIIGGGQAGGWAAKTLRDEGFSGEIWLARLPVFRQIVIIGVVFKSAAGRAVDIPEVG
jgi:cell division GTPase FtsZ